MKYELRREFSLGSGWGITGLFLASNFGGGNDSFTKKISFCSWESSRWCSRGTPHVRVHPS